MTADTCLNPLPIIFTSNGILKLNRDSYFNICTVHILLFCTMNQQMHNYLTYYHTSPTGLTLLCHPQAACS